MPAYTVPAVTNVQVGGDSISIDVSGTFDQGGAIIFATTRIYTTIRMEI